MTKTDALLDSDKLISMSANEIRTFYKKAILNKYIGEKAWSNKTDAVIANEMGISKSTLNRYKTELGLTPTRKPAKISAEKRQEMSAKRMKSKKMKDMYEKELNAVMTADYPTKEDFEREYNRVIKTYITGDNRDDGDNSDDEESNEAISSRNPIENVKRKQWRQKMAAKGGMAVDVDMNTMDTTAAREVAKSLAYASKI